MNAVAVFVVVVSGGLVTLALLPTLFGYRPVVVGSSSMEPSMKVADVVVAAPPTDDNIGVGTVVDFQTDDGSRIHRVVEVTPAGYRTKGDANQSADPDIVSAAQVGGVGVYLVPFVGLPRVWIDDGEYVKLVLLVGALMLAGFVSRADWLHGKRCGTDCTGTSAHDGALEVFA